LLTEENKRITIGILTDSTTVSFMDLVVSKSPPSFSAGVSMESLFKYRDPPMSSIVEATSAAGRLRPKDVAGLVTARDGGYPEVTCNIMVSAGGTLPFGTCSKSVQANLGGEQFHQMEALKMLSEKYPGRLLIAFDEAGTNSGFNDDTEKRLFKTVFEDSAKYYGCDKMRVKSQMLAQKQVALMQTKWYLTYTTRVKVATSTKAQEGNVRAICSPGGIITDIERRLMNDIVAEGLQDASKQKIKLHGKITPEVADFDKVVEIVGGDWTSRDWAAYRARVRALPG